MNGPTRHTAATGVDLLAIQLDQSQAVADAVARGRREAPATPRPPSDGLAVGRLSVYLEPRDAWVGVYVARDAVYVCPVPFLVLRWRRHG